jgi:hypothetical protein
MVKVIPARLGAGPNWRVEYDYQNPPDVFFDPNIIIAPSREAHPQSLTSLV